MQYYRYKPGGKKNGEYLPKTEEELICNLPRNLMMKRCGDWLQNAWAQIKKITDSYEDDEIERIYLKETHRKETENLPVEADVGTADGKMEGRDL